jgi:hypothetical protein
MTIAFLSADLARWDQALREGARSPVLGLPFFEDERPLRGAAGLCDWRLGGRLSRLLGQGPPDERRRKPRPPRLTGAFGEQLLMPAGPRLPWDRLVLFGLGPSRGFDETNAKRAGRAILDTLRTLVPAKEPPPGSSGATLLPVISIVPPGRSMGALSARQAIEALLQASTLHHLTIVESSAGQKEAGELIRRYTDQAVPA